MLAKQGIIAEEESQLIIKTLQEILADIEAGKVEFTIESEDIHMNIETLLTERIRQTGKKLHTARSRNDQIAVDIRLYLKKETAAIDSCLSQLLDALEKLAKEHTDTVMPGYTHLQRAQPVTLAYHLLAYYQMFSRDRERFADCLRELTGSLWAAVRWRVRHTTPTDSSWLKNLASPAYFQTVWMQLQTEILQ